MSISTVRGAMAAEDAGRAPEEESGSDDGADFLWSRCRRTLRRAVARAVPARKVLQLGSIGTLRIGKKKGQDVSQRCSV